MKIILAGCGKVGSTLVKELTAEGHDLTVIDQNGAVMESLMESYDIIGVQGNSAAMSVLEDANVQETLLLIAVTDEDEVNLLTCLTAHAMNPQIHTIARIRSSDYREQSYRMRSQYALNMIINPEETAAYEIARHLQMPGFLKTESFNRSAAMMAELRVKGGSKLDGLLLNQLGSVVKSRILICAVQRGDACIIPDGSFRMQPDDLLYITGAQASLADLLNELGVISRKARSAMIVGGSQTSYYLAQELQKSRIDTTILEIDPDKCSLLASELDKATIVQGDGSSQDFLEQEGIASFDSFITLTGLDELNIVMSMYASERNVPTVVTKLSHAENNRILDRLPIGTTISPKTLVSDGIIRYVRAMQNKKGAALTIHMIAQGKGEAIEFNVDDDTLYTDTPLKDVPTRKDVLIATISRGWHSELATGSSVYHKGDTVVVIANSDRRILKLNDVFEDAA